MGTRSVLLRPRRDLAAGIEADGREPERGTDASPYLRGEGCVEQGRDIFPTPRPG